MKAVIIRYGLRASLFILIFFFGTWLIFKSNEQYASQELLGYLGITISLLFIYFGLRYFRDHINQGQLSFGQGLKLGLMIAVLPSITFGLFNVVYVKYLDPQFMEKYYEGMKAQVKQDLPPAEYQAKILAMESEKALFNNPAMQFFTMALTVFVIGVIITVIATLILKRKTAVAVKTSL